MKRRSTPEPGRLASQSGEVLSKERGNVSPSYLKRWILNVRRATRQRRVVGQKPQTVRVCQNASGRAGPKCDRKTEVHGWRRAGREGVREGKVFADEARASPANRLSRPRQVRQLCRTLPAAIRRTLPNRANGRATSRQTESVVHWTRLINT